MLDDNNQIAPTGEGSTIEKAPPLYSPRPNTYRGRPAGQDTFPEKNPNRAGDPNWMTQGTGLPISPGWDSGDDDDGGGMSESPGHDAAGPVGASPTRPNPYRTGKQQTVPQAKPGKKH